jgi:tRNA (cytidine/uridine-2'-O-)-methyltransferase
VLFEPEIPPNTGNIARLCAALRTPLHLIEPLGFHLDDTNLRRAGLDYWPEVELRLWPSLGALLEARPGTGRWWVTKHGRQRYHEVAYAPGDLLIFGKESAGLPPERLVAEPERTLCLPMDNPAVRSLNLGTVAAVVLYEARRQLKLF